MEPICSRLSRPGGGTHRAPDHQRRRNLNPSVDGPLTAHRAHRREHPGRFFSDVLGRQLPNGWRFGLPNEIYLTADGTIFDLVGIPPDIEVPVFADADVAAGKDPALAMALEIVSQQS